MPTRKTVAVTALAAGAAVVAIPLLAQQGPASGPVARYDMRAGTLSGMGAMGSGMGGAMGMMLVGGAIVLTGTALVSGLIGNARN